MGIRLINYVNNQLGSPALYTDSYANRPAAGIGGRLFMSTDTHQIFQDQVTGWSLIADAGSGSSNLDQVTKNGNTTTWGINILSGDLTLQSVNFIYAAGLADGGVLFPSGGSGKISQDTTNFVWDNTNKRLGLGTATPSARLDIHSATGINATFNGTTTNNGTLQFQNAGTAKWTIGNYYSTGNNDFIIYDNANGTNRAYFLNTGYAIFPNSVIIGSSSRSSSYAFDVTGNGIFTGTLRNTLSAYFAINSGSVGIGTSSPSRLLDVSAAGNSYIRTSNTTNSVFVDILSASTAGYIGTQSNHDFIIQSNNTERLRITNAGQIYNSNPPSGDWAQVCYGLNSSGNSYGLLVSAGTTSADVTFQARSQSGSTYFKVTGAGNVLIGTTTDNGQKLQVSGTSYFSDNILINQTSGATNVKLKVRVSDQSSSNYAFLIDNSVVDLIEIRNDGLFMTGIATNSPYNYSTSGRSAVLNSSGILGYLVSTRESKANIQPIKSIDFINKLNAVQFNYRKKDNVKNVYTNELYDNITYGFIADEVEKINKDLTFYNEDGTLGGVEYNSMIAILTKAIQELNEKLVRNNIN